MKWFEREVVTQGIKKIVVGPLFYYFLGLMAILSASGASWSAPSTADAPPDLHNLFVEAGDAVQIKKIDNMPVTRKPYWIDNHRVILTVRKFKDWQAQDDERSKILIFNVDTGAIEETPYRGDVACIGTEGQILVHDYPMKLPNYRKPGYTWEDSEIYLTGKLGEPLSQFKRPRELGILDRFSCQFYDSLNHDFGKRHGITPLRLGDGVLDSAFFGAPDRNMRLVSPEGKAQWTIETDTLCTYGDLQYLPWLNRYFNTASWGNVAPGCMDLNENSWLFSTHKIEAKPLPRLIQEIRRPGKHIGGYGTTYWARPGMYVTVQYSSGFDGLYWQDEQSGQLKRVLKNPWGLDHLSPDGCRSLVQTNPAVIIELCKGA